jgi:uncharacterized protein
LSRRFTWDPAKREKTVRERGIDFADVATIFDGPTLEAEDARRNYGEVRVVALGRARSGWRKGRVLAVVFTMRGPPDDPECRIISARRANGRETKAYEELEERNRRAEEESQ